MQKSHTIGLFLQASQTEPHTAFSDTIKGVNRTISEEYNLFVRAIDDLKSFETITPMRYDGIILMSQSDSDNSFIYHIREKTSRLSC